MVRRLRRAMDLSSRTAARTTATHVTVLRRDGFEVRSTRARARWPRRSDATRACRSFACCRSRRAKVGRRAQLPPTRLRPLTSVGGFEIVVVKWFNRARGFGFLTLRRGHRRHLRPHGDAQARRFRRSAAGRHHVGALRARPEGVARCRKCGRSMAAADIRRIDLGADRPRRRGREPALPVQPRRGRFRRGARLGPFVAPALADPLET